MADAKRRATKRSQGSNAALPCDPRYIRAQKISEPGDRDVRRSHATVSVFCVRQPGDKERCALAGNRAGSRGQQHDVGGQSSARGEVSTPSLRGHAGPDLEDPVGDANKYPLIFGPKPMDRIRTDLSGRDCHPPFDRFRKTRVSTDATATSGLAAVARVRWPGFASADRASDDVNVFFWKGVRRR